jgi:hypothetical protein
MAWLGAEVFERRTTFLCLQKLIIFKVRKLMVSHSITGSSGTTLWYYRFRKRHVTLKEDIIIKFSKNVWSVTAFDGIEDDVVEKVAVWTLNSSKD